MFGTVLLLPERLPPRPPGRDCEPCAQTPQWLGPDLTPICPCQHAGNPRRCLPLRPAGVPSLPSPQGKALHGLLHSPTDRASLLRTRSTVPNDAITPEPAATYPTSSFSDPAASTWDASQQPAAGPTGLSGIVNPAAPRRVCIFVEPSPFTYVSGYKNRFTTMIKYLVEAGCQVLVVTTGALQGAAGAGCSPRHTCALQAVLQGGACIRLQGHCRALAPRSLLSCWLV